MSITILALHAHPDDESSKGAATIAKLTDAGARAVLVTATGGEAGDILNPAMDTPDIVASLPRVRAAELRDAAAIIGYSEIVELGYRDSGMPGSPDNKLPEAFCNQPIDDVLGRLVRLVRSERPDIVFGYDAHEFYPHPDHLRIHDLSVRLVEAAADAQRYPDAGPPWSIPAVLAPVFTRERIVALHEAMIARAGESPFDAWLERIEARGDDAPHVRIDVGGYVERGRDALRAHRTQVDPDGFWFVVPTSVVEAVYPWEDFEVLHAAPSWKPPFELIDVP